MFGRGKQRGSIGIDMTTGAMLPKVFRFAIPLMLSGVLQVLYNAADVVVVGQFAGAQALAAVGSTGALINLIVGMFTGLSTGAGVAVARAYGAGDYKLVQRYIHTAISLAIITGVAVLGLGQAICRQMLVWMGSPEDVIDLTELYLRIYFIGMPAVMLYNYGAAILRAIGDTKRPLYYLTLSGLVNVVLNLILVIFFHMGVAGVAIATVVSQVISCALVIICLMRTEGAAHLDFSRLILDKKAMGVMLHVGLPAGIQGTVFALSNVLIQSSINSFGSIAMAGNSAAANLEGICWTCTNSFHQAAVTVSSQNLGAKKYDRVRRTLWVCLGSVMIAGALVGNLINLLGVQLLGLYNSDPEVIRFGLIRLNLIMPIHFICGMMDVTSGQLRGVGYSITSMVIALTGACAFRILWLQTVFAANPTLYTLYVSYPVSWALTCAVNLLFCLIAARRKLPKTNGVPA